MRPLLIFLIIASSTAHADEGRRPVARSAEKPPKWVRSIPPEDSQAIYFVGFTSDAATLEEGREQAVKKAMGEIVGYFGQEGASTFVSTDTETQTGRKYEVQLKIVFSGKKMTLRGIQLADWYYEEFRAGEKRVFDFHALVRYPREEYEQVLQLERERAGVALTKYQEGLASAQRSQHTQAIALFDESLAVLENIARVVAMEHPDARNTVLLKELIGRERKKAEQAQNRVDRTVTIRASCAPNACDGLETELARAATSVGYRVVTSTSATLRLEIDIEATASGESSGVHFARAKGTYRVTDNRGVIRGGGETPPLKAGQISEERAIEKATSEVRKTVSIEVRKVLRALTKP